MSLNQNPDANEYNKRWFTLLLTPSWVSLLVCLFCAFWLLFGVIFAAQYQGTSYQQQVSEIRAQQVNAQYSDPDAEFEGLEGNTFVDIAPLLVLWGIVGVVVYLFAASIVQAFEHAAEFKSQLGYVNADRNEMLRAAFIQLGVRTVVGITWITYVILFFNEIVTYSISTALAASATWLSLESILYGLLCLIVFGLSIHIHAVLLRLLFLKPRFFSKALYID